MDMGYHYPKCDSHVLLKLRDEWVDEDVVEEENFDDFVFVGIKKTEGDQRTSIHRDVTSAILGLLRMKLNVSDDVTRDLNSRTHFLPSQHGHSFAGGCTH